MTLSCCFENLMTDASNRIPFIEQILLAIKCNERLRERLSRSRSIPERKARLEFYSSAVSIPADLWNW